ncbi:MAG: FAD binding domain-containing protein [Patulibacter sp.]|nr:FAD binding domain-containing protein [Patulibacter sp.]
MDLNTVEAIVAPTDRAALADFGTGDAWLAGGSALFAEPNPHLRRLFDLTAFAWPALTRHAGGDLEIAATCTLAELSRIAVPADAPALGLALRCCQSLRGSFKVWNVGTVGGNICAALPAGPMTSLTAGLDGRCTIWSADGAERQVTVPELVVGDGRTSLCAGELLRSITLPAHALAARATMRQASLLPLGRSAALLIGRIDPDGTFHLTITASTPSAVQLRFADGLPSAADLVDAIDARLTSTDYFDDLHGTPAWRRHLTRTLAVEIRDELAAGAPDGAPS